LQPETRSGRGTGLAGGSDAAREDTSGGGGVGVVKRALAGTACGAGAGSPEAVTIEGRNVRVTEIERVLRASALATGAADRRRRRPYRFAGCSEPCLFLFLRCALSCRIMKSNTTNYPWPPENTRGRRNKRFVVSLSARVTRNAGDQRENCSVRKPGPGARRRT